MEGCRPSRQNCRMALTELRRLRDASKLTLETIAADTDISVSQLSRYESGDRDPRLSHLQRLAERFRVPVSNLIGEPSAVQVPIISWVSAGKLADPMEPVPVEDARIIGFTDLGPGDFFGLEVRGTSMDRISPEGAIVVVNRADRDLVAGKPYVFSVRGEVTYKLWRPDPPRLTPFSTDPMHEPEFVHNRPFEVVGRVRRSVLNL